MCAQNNPEATSLMQQIKLDRGVDPDNLDQASSINQINILKPTSLQTFYFGDLFILDLSCPYKRDGKIRKCE